MKLHINARSERGKPLRKSGNEYIELELMNINRKKVLELKVYEKDDHLVLEGYAQSSAIPGELRAESYIFHEFSYSPSPFVVEG